MKKKKRRRLRKSLRIPFLIICLLLIGLSGFGIFILTSPKEKSIHEDAKRYSTKTCVAFYPDSINGKEVAKSLCDNVVPTEEKIIYDYSLIPYGDYNLVEYGMGVHYYIYKDNKPLKI